MKNSVLKRYALAYIKKSGSSDNVQEFLQHCNHTPNLTWSEENFDRVYGKFTRLSSTNGHNAGRGNDYQYNARYPVGSQTTHIHVHNRGLDFWDFLLLQCCIDSLFGGRGHTTNVTNINYVPVSREDVNKEAALGMVVAVVCAVFHSLMCYFYHSSRKEARKEEKIDYLDNKLKTFRNIEFAVSAISLAALIACVFYPVLPTWGLAVLGVNSLVCFAGGLAFHMKHEKESDNIEKAEEAVRNYGPPPPYSFQDPNSVPSAPPYSEFGDPNATQQSKDYQPGYGY